MNTDTGHLISGELYKRYKKELEESEKEFKALGLEEQAERQRVVDALKDSVEKLANYEPVPEELRLAAERKLAGKDEAMVSLTSGGKLSKWAVKKRKAKRKMTSASRKGNRG